MLVIDEPTPVEPGEIPDPDRLSARLVEDIAGLAGPLAYFRFPAGNSNLTYLVKAEGRELVLKREPPGAKARSAHDMRREFRVISAVHDFYPLAPRPLLLWEDPELIGGTFFVMERVAGAIVRQGTAAELTPDQARRQFLRLIEAQAELHTLDVGGEPLASLGRPAGYRARQLEGWVGRMAGARLPETPDSGDIEAWLAANLPGEPEAAALVHNDFKLDNLAWDPVDPTRLVAVLDWEMATLGDPLMDLGVTLSFWAEEGDPPAFRALRSMPSDRPGVPRRAAAWRSYLERRSLSSEALPFYLAFGFYRRAVIEQQKLARFRSGQSADPRFAGLGPDVAVLLDMSRAQAGLPAAAAKPDPPLRTPGGRPARGVPRLSQKPPADPRARNEEP